MSDFIYADPPLVEVIAEVMWRTTPVELIPGAAIDVAFGDLSAGLPGAMGLAQYNVREYVAPPTMPQELLAGKPVLRFRKQPDTWPLYQFGPGLFACNAVPPYEGWAHFQTVLSQGLNVLASAWPSKHAFEIAKLQLRYINAFTSKFGYTGDASFLDESLRFGCSINRAALGQFTEDVDSVHTAILLQFPLSKLENTTATISASPGQSRGSTGYIVTLAAELNVPEKQVVDTGLSLRWFRDSHNILRDIFEATTTDQARLRFGEKILIGEKGQ